MRCVYIYVRNNLIHLIIFAECDIIWNAMDFKTEWHDTLLRLNYLRLRLEATNIYDYYHALKIVPGAS